MRAGVLLLAAACGNTNAPAAVTANHVEPRAPHGPPPKIEVFADGTFVPHRLPAVARSGALVVGTTRDPDGGRGNPNLTLDIRDRLDARVKRLEILAASDYEALVTGSGPTPVLARRVADANTKLSNLHAAHDFVEMTPLVVTDTDRSYPSRAEGAGLVVTWDGNLHVSDGTDHQLAWAPGETWQAPRGMRCAQCDPCANPVILAAAYHAAGIDLVLVEIGYSGTDTCPEPPPQLHVLAW